MKDAPSASRTAGVSDEAVQKATGKTWPEWFAVLDEAGGQQMTHKEIVAYVHSRHGVGPWWQQMVTVGYEQGRKQRQKGQMDEGFQVSANKTVAVPIARLYAAWADEAQRAGWLGRRKLEVRKATPRKSMRITWGAGKKASSVSVGFYAKGRAKSQVSLEHSKLPDAAGAEKMKLFWRKALEKLKGLLER